jgi:hypothetical protein
MKNFKILFGIFALLSLPSGLLAGDQEQQDYIVLNVGDTLYGKVQYIDETSVRYEFYKKVRLTTVDGKRKKYNKSKISAFRVNGFNYESFWLSQSSKKIILVNPQYDIDSKGEQYFLKVLSKGKLAHYELEWFDQENTGLLSMTLLKKEKDPFFIRADQGLLGLKRKALQDYFLDCPQLSEKINQKQLNEISQIVDFYNSNCIH